MARLFQKRPPAAPQPPQGSLEADVLHWSRECDRAASELASALAMRRLLLARLIGQTALRSKAPLNNLFAAFSVARSMAWHVDQASGRSVLNHLASMHVAVPSRVSFEHSAAVAIASSASGRPSPDPVGATDAPIPDGGSTAPAPKGAVHAQP